ncbi:MAG: PD40 domain-containing protein [Anaerolineales bacterium]|nr:PD40 domain-containing protein [Anaerolineales bacterium]
MKPMVIAPVFLPILLLAFAFSCQSIETTLVTATPFRPPLITATPFPTIPKSIPATSTPTNSPTDAATPSILPTVTQTQTVVPFSNNRLAVIAKDIRTTDTNIHPAVYLMDADGSFKKLLLSGHVSADSVSWSSDGNKLVFSAFTLEFERFDIYTINADGTDLTRFDLQIPGINSYTEPSWSPNGRHIVFSQGRTIQIMDSLGEYLGMLTTGNAPSWSPDGKSIVFVRRHEMNLMGDIFIIDLESKEERQLTSDLYTNRPIWSPDGKKIAFYGYDGTGEKSGVFYMNADGTNLIQLIDYDAYPSWTPDGNHLLIAPNKGLDKHKLVMIRISDSKRFVFHNLSKNYIYFYGEIQPIK